MSYSYPNSGDANQDGVIDIGDAAYIASAVVGLPGFTLNQYMDINNDGLVDIGDAAYIAQVVVGLKPMPQPLDPSGNPTTTFEFMNQTSNSIDLVLNTELITPTDANLGAMELKLDNITMIEVVPPAQFTSGVYKTGANKFVFVNSGGVDLDTLPSQLVFQINFSDIDVGTLAIDETETKMWDNSFEPQEMVLAF
jgi:hypothetical protein